MSTFSMYVVGTPAVKLSCVQTFKAGYNPAHDYWKKAREIIPGVHQDGSGKAGLDAFVKTITAKKTANYEDRIDAYKKWWGKHTLTWTPGKSRTWSAGGIDVVINPELFLSIDGTAHVIKLYFNKDKISTDRARVMLRLMELQYHKVSKPVVGVLDLGQGRLVTPSLPLGHLDVILAGEAASFAAVYNSLP